MNGRAKWEENGENGSKMGKKMGKGKEAKKIAKRECKSSHQCEAFSSVGGE